MPSETWGWSRATSVIRHSFRTDRELERDVSWLAVLYPDYLGVICLCILFPNVKTKAWTFKGFSLKSESFDGRKSADPAIWSSPWVSSFTGSRLGLMTPVTAILAYMLQMFCLNGRWRLFSWISFSTALASWRFMIVLQTKTSPASGSRWVQVNGNLPIRFCSFFKHSLISPLSSGGGDIKSISTTGMVRA